MRGDPLDRAGHLRKDEAFLAAARSAKETKLIPIWRGRCLVEGRPARAVIPTVAEMPELVELAEEITFLGLDGDDAVLMLDLPPADEPAAPDGASWLDLFVVGGQLPVDEMTLLAYARGMALWHRSERFHAKTGAPTRIAEGGFLRETEDGEKLFPRTDPAVMVLVTHEDRALLARGPQFPPGMYSALAGFVEPGETLEECVTRETREEVGLVVTAPRYFASQPWPFPRSLMIGFYAEAVDPSTLALQPDEIADAKWVTRDEARRPEGFFVPPPFSLAHHLIRAWAEA